MPEKTSAPSCAILLITNPVTNLSTAPMQGRTVAQQGQEGLTLRFALFALLRLYRKPGFAWMSLQNG